MELTHEQKQRCADVLGETSGENQQVQELADEFGCGVVDIESAMADMNYERCPECDWWVEAGELINDKEEPCPCSSCQPRNGEDDDDEDA